MRWLSPVLAVVISIPLFPGAYAQAPAPKLNLVIVEGEGVINNIRQRTAREPIVQVEDENHKPVAGAAVVFLLPNQGAGGAFANGAHTLTVTTNSQGQAVARGFHPNQLQGHFDIHVTASHNGETTTAVIAESNVVGAAAATAVAGGISAKLIVILAIAGAAAAGGAYYATHSGSNGSANSSGATTSIIITPGTGLVGPPR
jgi:hypothetical protein